MFLTDTKQREHENIWLNSIITVTSRSPTPLPTNNIELGNGGGGGRGRRDLLLLFSRKEPAFGAQFSQQFSVKDCSILTSLIVFKEKQYMLKERGKR